MTWAWRWASTGGGLELAEKFQPVSCFRPLEARLEVKGVRGRRAEDLALTLYEAVVDTKHDAWSYGVVVYLLATRQDLHQAVSTEAIDNVASGTAADLKKAVQAAWSDYRTIHDILVDVILGCLHRSPGDRFSAGLALETLQAPEVALVYEKLDLLEKSIEGLVTNQDQALFGLLSQMKDHYQYLLKKRDPAARERVKNTFQGVNRMLVSMPRVRGELVPQTGALVGEGEQQVTQEMVQHALADMRDTLHLMMQEVDPEWFAENDI